MGRISVCPLDGFGLAVIELDVAHELSCEIVDGGKDASGDDLAFDLGEPDFDLVEPGRIRWSEVELYLWMVRQELLDPWSLVRR